MKVGVVCSYNSFLFSTVRIYVNYNAITPIGQRTCIVCPFFIDLISEHLNVKYAPLVLYKYVSADATMVMEDGVK
jgi:hypothetical protein